MTTEKFPKKNKYRAQRRALNRRKEDKVMAFASRLFRDRFHFQDEEHERLVKEKYVKRHRNGISRCSCWMCANRRQYEGPTIQEKRHGIVTHEE